VPVFNSPAALYSGVGLGNGSYPGYYNHDQGGINNRIHPWVTDTWKVNSSLTLAFGLGVRSRDRPVFDVLQAAAVPGTNSRGTNWWGPQRVRWNAVPQT
jgi:hypothetical protein